MKKIIVITGPTGVGKTKLSIAIAKHFDGEIINADSVQIYKDLNIGTAKVTDEEKAGIIHHLIDIKDIDENYTVYDYQKDGRNKINEILKKGKVPIVVGGTGLYIKALLYDYKFNNEQVRRDYEEYTMEELYQKLIAQEPSNNIHRNNRSRIIRALNKIENNGKLDDEKGNKLLYDALFIGLTTDRDILYKRINNRVDKMIDKGLIKEVKDLYDKGLKSRALLSSIGYKELYQYFDGELSLNESILLIKKNSRHYAKRQYTWFNNQMEVKWFEVNFVSFDETIKEVTSYINNNI